MYIHTASAHKGRLNEVLVKYFPRRYNCYVESRLLPCRGRWERQGQPRWGSCRGWSPSGPQPSQDFPLQPPFAESGDAPRLTQQPGWFSSVCQGKWVFGTHSPRGGCAVCMEVSYSTCWELSRKSVTDSTPDYTRYDKESRRFNRRNIELSSSERGKHWQQGDKSVSDWYSFKFAFIFH